LALLDNPSIDIQSQSQPQVNINDVASEYVFLNHEDETSKQVDESSAISIVNGDENLEENGQVDEERLPQNGAEAYENLVKSLTEGDGDYMKVISEESEIDENFQLGAMIDTFGF
jgi:hypothetical protein